MVITLTESERMGYRRLLEEIEGRGARNPLWPLMLIVRVVRRHLGWRGLCELPWAFLRASKRGRPKGVSCPWGLAIRLGLLAALYERVARGCGPERAEGLCRDLMLSLGTLEWCRVFPRSRARGMGRRAFTEWFQTKVKASFGSRSTDRFELRGDDEMVLTVSDCMLLRAFQGLGVARLAPYLCQTDEVYLGALGPGIRFRHDSILATGGPACVFRFHFTGVAQADKEGTR
jgi:hypothetical protein